MKKTVNSFQLKCICLSMMIIGMGLQVWCRAQVLASPADQPETLDMLYFIGMALYLASFPISAFLLVEAVKHTSDKRKLLWRLLLAAVVSEFPMDVANFGISQVELWGRSQNYYFTLVIGLLVLYAMDAVNKKYGSGTMKANLCILPVYLLATMGAVLLRTEQSSVGVLTILALSLFYGNKMFSLITVAALHIFFVSTGQSSLAGLEYIPALGVLLTWMYNGEPGKQTKLTKVLFYAAYPVAFCIMGAVVQWMY